MTRIKICGITRQEDALLAAQSGADALGFVFYNKSPRHITAEKAQSIIASLPPFVSTVGLFVNAAITHIQTVLSNCPLDMLQFHGDESAEFCRQFQRPYIKAIRVQSAQNITDAVLNYPDARALLLDTYQATAFGGTGKTFDWSLIPEHISMPWILAGGLNPDNIANAIEKTHALAVDVSGGVEKTHGEKDPQKIIEFIQGARSARVFTS